MHNKNVWCDILYSNYKSQLTEDVIANPNLKLT